MRGLPLSLGIALLVGCGGGTPPTAPVVPPPPAPIPAPLADVQVVVREDATADRWSVTFNLKAPAEQLVFLSHRNAFRTDTWRSETPGYVWAQANGHEVLRTDGEAARTIRVSFPSDFGIKPKDYELNLKFADGSRLLFTGHLAALPCSGSACAHVVDEPDAVTFGWKLATAPERHVLAAGQRGLEELTLAPLPYSASSYAFFGANEPVENDHVLLVVDKGMPPWLVKQAEQAVPLLFAHYAERLGTALDFKPLVFMSFGGAERNGFSNGGGVHSGVVQLAAEGSGWLTDTAASRAKWFRFVAHESFHLWNAQLFRPGLGPSEEWLSEGSADYFSIQAAAVLGVIDQAALREAMVEAANLCILELEGKPLATAHLRGTHGSFYTCGAAGLFALDGRIREATSGQHGVDDVFRAMFQRAKHEAEGLYTTWDLLESAVAISEDPLVGTDLERLLHVGLESEVDEFFAAAFRRAGWNVTVTKEVGDSVKPGHLLFVLGRRLATCACPAHRSFTVRAGQLTLQANDGCQLKRSLTVASVGGVDLSADPGTALLRTLATINGGLPIGLRSQEGEDVTLRCDDNQRDASFTGLLRIEAP